MKKLISCLLVMACIIGIFNGNPVIVQAKAGDVPAYADMTVYKDNIIYLKRYSDESAAVCRFKSSTGKTSAIVNEKKGITSFTVYNATLFYGTWKEGNITTYSVSMSGKNKKKICDGELVYVDDEYVIYTKYNALYNYLVYKKDRKTNKEVPIAKGQISNYLKSIGSTLYFVRYEEKSKKVTLLSMKTSDSKLKQVTSDKVKDAYVGCSGTISDVISIQGNLYYQYGTYQGSGGFWYGTLIKLTAKGKKTTISKNMVDDSIYYDKTSIYYMDGMEEIKYVAYNLKTEKKKNFKMTLTEDQNVCILGAKTYLIDTGTKNTVKISRFTTGTNKENLRKNFIKISYKQNQKYTYWSSVKEIGKYYLVFVEAIDFNDMNYGWRGNYIGTKWYVADSNGKVIGNFQ